jgi:hypothetical protein
MLSARLLRRHLRRIWWTTYQHLVRFMDLVDGNELQEPQRSRVPWPPSSSRRHVRRDVPEHHRGSGDSHVLPRQIPRSIWRCHVVGSHLLGEQPSQRHELRRERKVLLDRQLRNIDHNERALFNANELGQQHIHVSHVLTNGYWIIFTPGQRQRLWIRLLKWWPNSVASNYDKRLRQPIHLHPDHYRYFVYGQTHGQLVICRPSDIH